MRLRVPEGLAELQLLRQEEESGLFVEADASFFVLPLASLTLIPSLYAERSVADRVANPHGEHAEGTWELLGEEEARDSRRDR